MKLCQHVWESPEGPVRGECNAWSVADSYWDTCRVQSEGNGQMRDPPPNHWMMEELYGPKSSKTSSLQRFSDTTVTGSKVTYSPQSKATCTRSILVYTCGSSCQIGKNILYLWHVEYCMCEYHLYSQNQPPLPINPKDPEIQELGSNFWKSCTLCRDKKIISKKTFKKVDIYIYI